MGSFHTYFISEINVGSFPSRLAIHKWATHFTDNIGREQRVSILTRHDSITKQRGESETATTKKWKIIVALSIVVLQVKGLSARPLHGTIQSVHAKCE